MNALIEMEASKLTSLFGNGDVLGIRMFMEQLHMPLDVQDRLFDEISALANLDSQQICHLIEAHGQSNLPERLGN